MTYIVSEDEHNETQSIDNLEFFIGQLNINSKYIGFLDSEVPCPKCGFPVDGEHTQDYYNPDDQEYKLECFECDWNLHKKFNKEKNLWTIQK